jgi:hypothetical protein
VSHPVIVQGLVTLTRSVNHGNALAGTLDRRDAVAVLQTLHDGGHRLVAEDIYAWALANQWPARGAERLKELTSRIAGGHRPRLGATYPFRDDILEVWRTGASEAGS